MAKLGTSAHELDDMNATDLEAKLREAKEELFNLRFQLATGQLDNSSRLKALRHDVARTLTVLRERHLEAEVEAALARVEAEALERSREAQESGRLEGTPLGELERGALDEQADEATDETNEEEEA
jgi:large subunit ribosomal protein L29